MPHPGQRSVRRQAQRFNWLAAGRRWRKTTLGVSLAVEGALTGQRIIWGAPTYDQVRVAWDETRHALGARGDFNQSRMTADLGGQILFRSLDDPDNVRSHTAHGVIIDEAGDVKAPAWYEVLRPMLSSTRGWAWLIGTPKGRNYFWQESVKAPDSPDSAAWQVPTLGARIENGQLVRQPHPMENPEFSFDEMLSLFETMPERSFRQEILAEFVEDGGGVFRHVRDCIARRLACYSGEFVAGVDWAQLHDWTVITVMDKQTRRVVAKDRFNRVDWELQRGRVKAINELWRPTEIICEINSIGSPNFEALQREGLPVRAFETTASSKPPLIESLVLAFEKHEIEIPNDPILIAELEAYERKVSTTTGRSSYGAPAGMHDDCVMSLALAWWSIATYRPHGGIHIP